MKKVLVIGSSNMDLSLNMYKVPSAGETVTDDGGVAYTPGGKGANSAVAFKKLGADTVFFTKLGADLHGQKLYGYYKDEGLDTSLIKVDREYPTGFSAVLKEADGTNRVIYYPGANLHITSENIREAFGSNPDALYIGFETSFDTAVSAAKYASAKGIPVFIDASPASKIHSLEALPEVEIFSPNEIETYEYTGILPAGADSSLRAALALRKRVKCKYLVIKQGARGAFVYDGKHYRMIPAYRADKVVDTTAAGDVFTAALTLSYIQGADILSATEFGAAAGAITVSRLGASVSAPTFDEVCDFIKTHPQR